MFCKKHVTIKPIMKRNYVATLKNLMTANALTNRANPKYGSIVEDAVYDMQCNNGIWSLGNKRLISSAGKLNQDNIVVILESPHIWEFDSTGTGLMPLRRDSCFKQDFVQAFSSSPSVINKVNLNQQMSYSVHLMNAIQLQCSLGVPTEYYRDYVFLYYWETMYVNFESRLHSLLSNTTLAVINLCTQGSHKECKQFFNSTSNQWDFMGTNCDNQFMNLLGFKFPYNNSVNSLQGLVDESVAKVINNKSPSTLHTTGIHPASWRRVNKNILRIK